MIPSEGAPGGFASRRLILAVLWSLSLSAAAIVIWRVWARPDRPFASKPADRIPAEPSLPKASANNVMVRVEVRVKDEADFYLPVGTPLPNRVSLKLRGKDGKQYTAYFDRVGTWGMEVPPGDYGVPAVQPDLGSWKWKLSGPGVTGDRSSGLSVRFVVGMSPTLDLVLY